MTETAYFSINGMHTRACESYLERRVRHLDGVHNAAASYTTEMIRVTYDPERVEQDTIEAELSARGYLASDPTPEETPAERNDFDFDHVRTIFSVIAVSPVYITYATFFYPVYLGVIPTESLNNHAVVTGLYGPVAMFSTITVLAVGFPILRSAAISLRERRLTLDILIALTALSAYIYSLISLLFLDRLYLFFDIATSIIVLATIANHARAHYKRRALRDLTDIVDNTETTVRRLGEDGATETVPVEECDGGDRLLVRPGERIPLDGTIVEGHGTVNEALITGEARPKQKIPGDSVVGGSVLADGALEIAVGDDAKSTLDRLRSFVWDIQTGGTTVDQLTDRVAAAYTPLVIVLAVLTLGAWTALGATSEAVARIALTVLIVACPVALTLVTPLAIGRGLATAAARRVPVLDRTVLERVTDADVVAFDKTGTLTTGEMYVASVRTDASETEEAVLRRASAVESRSSHPIAAAIRNYASSEFPDNDEFERHRYGVTATVAGERSAVGNPRLFDTLGWETPEAVEDAIESVREQGAIPTVVGWDGVARGIFAIEDEPRPDWKTTVSAFADAGRRVVVITGDDSAAARRFENHPGIDTVYADVAPEEKEELVQRLREDGAVAMIGDGTNDAPALAAADLGIAMISGSDFTATVADALITGDDLSPVRSLFAVASATQQRLRENLALALAMPAIGLPLAVFGYVTPLVATTLTAVGIALVLANSHRTLTTGDIAIDD